MASICTDNRLQGMHNNIEATPAHLLSYDPVIKKQAASTRHLAAQMEGDSAEIADTIAKKPTIGNQACTSATTQIWSTVS